RRTVRFILFGGEEEGLLGSTAYARQHLAEVPKIDAILISDTGAQPAKGWYLMGRDDEKAAVDSLKPLLRGLGADDTSSNTAFIFETDHAALDVLGVPSLVLWNDTDKYFTLHHKASDTFDSVVEKDLAQGAAVLAVTAYAIADSSQPLGKHLSADEVQAMIKKSGNTDSYNYLKKTGAFP
ncbi:MAG: M28 family peptidase, partial [Candidatus Sulfotelmatobacter sp.]